MNVFIIHNNLDGSYEGVYITANNLCTEFQAKEIWFSRQENPTWGIDGYDADLVDDPEELIIDL